jgi:hypothetical protein
MGSPGAVKRPRISMRSKRNLENVGITTQRHVQFNEMRDDGTHVLERWISIMRSLSPKTIAITLFKPACDDQLQFPR